MRPCLEPLEDRRVPTTFVVNTLLDQSPALDGVLSLREAVLAAWTNQAVDDAPAGSATLDTITFAPNLAFGTINAESPLGELLYLNGGGDLRILGPVAGNAAGIVISGQNAIRVLDVTSAASLVELDGLTIRQGNSVVGGAVFNAGPNTKLADVNILDNVSTSVAGGLANSGVLTLTSCIVSNNTSTNSAGGILNGGGANLTINSSRIVGNSSGFNGGGILNTSGLLVLTNTTIAGNLAAGDGGGIDNIGGSSTALLWLRQCTVSGNRALGFGGGVRSFNQNPILTCDDTTFAENTGIGGAIMNDGQLAVYTCTIVHNADTSNSAAGAGGIACASGPFTLENCIVSLNDAGPACANANLNGTISTNHANFIGGDPRLGPLQDNGGSTLTMAPLPGSPVIDGGDNNFLRSTRDERHAHRLANGDSIPSAIIDQGAVEYSPGLIHPVLAGADAGSTPEVKVFDGLHGEVRYDFLAYGAGFLGGVRVASGDVTGDGVDDFVTGAGPGGGPQVNVYDGATGTLVKAFMAFAPNFAGGVFVAVGDVNGDGFGDVVVGADAGGSPSVSIFSGKDLAKGTKTLVTTFLAYDASFTGGVRVAIGDLDPDFDQFADVVTGKGPGTAPRVKVFSGGDLLQNKQAPLLNFLAYDPAFTGGVYVASVDTDDIPEIVTGAGAGGGPAVNVFNGLTGAPLSTFFAYGVNSGGGVRVSAADLNGDGITDIITGRGPGGEPTVKVFDGRTQAALDRFDALDLAFTGGVFVGGA